MTRLTLSPNQTLPDDLYTGALAGRVFRPDVEGPSVVAIREEGVIDLSTTFPTMRDLCEAPDPAAALKAATGEKSARCGRSTAYASIATGGTIPGRLTASSAAVASDGHSSRMTSGANESSACSSVRDDPGPW